MNIFAMIIFILRGCVLNKIRYSNIVAAVRYDALGRHDVENI